MKRSRILKLMLLLTLAASGCNEVDNPTAPKTPQARPNAPPQPSAPKITPEETARIAKAFLEARRALPVVTPTPLDAGHDHFALERHLLRVKKAANAEAEAREIEALAAWLKKHNVAQFFTISHGHDQGALTGQELLDLSSKPGTRLIFAGGVQIPVIIWNDITLKDPKNVIRFIPVIAPAADGKRAEPQSALEAGESGIQETSSIEDG